MIDLLEIADFIPPTDFDALKAELRAAPSYAATVLSAAPGGVAMPGVRSTKRLAVADATRDHVHALMQAARPRLEQHFGIALTSCEEPQFLRYLPGDFFVPHQDGNTPLVYDDSRFRRVSVVIFMSRQTGSDEPETYGGGSLVMHGHYTQPNERVPVAPRPGTLVAFRSETTHEVIPVTHGERYTIVSWFR